MWRVGPDEALLLEVTPPECHYWEVQLGDRWYQSLDYVNRPTTINDAQATVDDDGMVRIVISAHDPGVANWLDTGGIADGYMTYRYNLATSAPVPSLTVVPLSELEDRVHPSAVRLDPAERAARQREWRRAVLGRFRR